MSLAVAVCQYFISSSPFRSVREDQAARLEGEAHRQEEEDDGEERQPQPILQRVLRLHGRTE